jgi:hypothetical protein
VETLGAETDEIEATWSPEVGFRENARSGRFVNVSPEGYRFTFGQGPWPPDPRNFNVFVFGGSTAFGYGVQDEQTIPSHLAKRFAAVRPDAKVYNFGRGMYFSGIERALFIKRIAHGNVPDLAVFIDGTNENLHPQRLARIYMTAFIGDNARALREAALGRLPLYRAAVELRERWRPPAAPQDEPLTAEFMAARYDTNRRLIESVAREYGVKTFFVWQPHPLYKYDIAYHNLADPDSLAEDRNVPGLYRLMAARRPDRRPLWCADLQEGRREELYVDTYHYSPAFSATVADCVADGLIRGGYLRSKKPLAK